MYVDSGTVRPLYRRLKNSTYPFGKTCVVLSLNVVVKRLFFPLLKNEPCITFSQLRIHPDSRHYDFYFRQYK